MSQVANDRLRHPPEVAGVQVRPFWSMVLYVLLVASAAVALYVQRAPTANVDERLVRSAPWIFLVFAIGFATYRFALVAAGRYSPFKAFLQIVVAALFFMLLLLPGERNSSMDQSLSRLLSDRDARVRALAAEVAGSRSDLSVAPQLVQLLDDRSELVRHTAHQALIRLNGGTDLGAPSTNRAIDAWRGRFP